MLKTVPAADRLAALDEFDRLIGTVSTLDILNAVTGGSARSGSDR